MLKAVQGVYHLGKVDLLESPKGIQDDIPVIVTFLTDKQDVDLVSRGIDATQAQDLRGRLSTFCEDWEDPVMNIYDERYGGHD